MLPSLGSLSRNVNRVLARELTGDREEADRVVYMHVPGRLSSPCQLDIIRRSTVRSILQVYTDKADPLQSVSRSAST